jgi:excisionase family DNA binding protein
LPGTVNDQPRYLTAEEVAADLRLTVKTVRNMCERGQIPARKLGGRWLVTRENLDALVAGERP